MGQFYSKQVPKLQRPPITDTGEAACDEKQTTQTRKRKKLFPPTSTTTTSTKPEIKNAFDVMMEPTTAKRKRRSDALTTMSNEVNKNNEKMNAFDIMKIAAKDPNSFHRTPLSTMSNTLQDLIEWVDDKEWGSSASSTASSSSLSSLEQQEQHTGNHNFLKLSSEDNDVEVRRGYELPFQGENLSKVAKQPEGSVLSLIHNATLELNALAREERKKMPLEKFFQSTIEKTDCGNSNVFDEEEQARIRSMLFKPIEQKEPAEGVCLRSIGLHAEDYGTDILGFTFFYSDGCIKTTGDARVANRNTFINLRKGEHITSFLRKGSAGCFFALTTQNRILPDACDCDNECYISVNGPCDFTSTFAHVMEKGTVLKSFILCSSFKTIVSIETQSLDSINDQKDVWNCNYSCPWPGHYEQIVEPQMVPSLAKLSLDRYQADMRCIASSAETASMLSTESTFWNWGCAIDETVFEQIKKLHDSEEYKLLLLLEKVRRFMKYRVELRKNQLLATARKKITHHNDSYQRQADNIIDKYKVDYSELYKKQNEKMKFCCETLGFQHLQRMEHPMVCSSTQCRKAFDTCQLPSNERCCVIGCFVERPNCGCEMKHCEYCYGVYCNLHYDDNVHHKTRKCRRRAKYRCGWYRKSSGEFGVALNYCHRMLKSSNVQLGSYCSACYTYVCNRCSRSCPECDKAYCSVCLSKQQTQPSRCTECSYEFGEF